MVNWLQYFHIKVIERKDDVALLVVEVNALTNLGRGSSVGKKYCISPNKRLVRMSKINIIKGTSSVPQCGT